MGLIGWSSLLVVVAALVYVGSDIYNFMGEWRLSDPEWSKPGDTTCRLIAGNLIRGGEDLALYKNGLAIVSAGDLYTTFTGDPARTTGTGAFVVDLRNSSSEPPVRKLELIGFPETTKFVGHGMYLSNSTNRVYFVVHGDHATGKSFIDAFDIEGDDYNSLALRHVSRVSSELFPAAGINDVVEGRHEREVFVSVWRAHSQTTTVKAHGPENKASLGPPQLLMHRWMPICVYY